MNNSLIALQNITLELEEKQDRSPELRAKEAELVTIIETIQTVSESREWKILKEKIFDGVVEALLKRRNVEVEKKPLNGPLIHSINGQLEWAKRYSSFDTLADIYKLELQSIRKNLNAT